MDIKAATRAETRRIMEKQIMKREECKNRMLAERARLQQIVCTQLSPRRAWYAVATYRVMPCFLCEQRDNKKRAKARRTAKKMSNSPFHIDLVAESERIDEVHTQTRTDTVHASLSLSLSLFISTTWGA